MAFFHPIKKQRFPTADCTSQDRDIAASFQSVYEQILFFLLETCNVTFFGSLYNPILIGMEIDSKLQIILLEMLKSSQIF